MTSDVLRGNKHGFIIFRASHAKPHDAPWKSNDEIQQEHYQAHVQNDPNSPLQFELPRILPQVMTSSYYDKPDPLRAEQAAARLFSPEQLHFAMVADAAARKYMGLTPDQQHEHFTHLHGIGSWEGKMEPSMATVFHKPITPSQLQKIAADVGSWARQDGIMAFTPHSSGVEQLLHMRIPTHSPSIKQLDPGTIAEISHNLTQEFNKYFDTTPQGVKEFLMPGRTFLPDTNGHTDALVWVPPFVDRVGQGRIHDAFHDIASRLKGGVQYWRGTGKIIGGMHPYENSADSFPDERKRAIADENYKRALSLPEGETAAYSGDVEIPKYEPVEPEKFARSPAGTGIVIRGVYYEPGKMIPDLITPSSGTSRQVPAAPAASPPELQPTRMSRDEFCLKIRNALSKRKGKNNADDAPARTGDHSSS